VILPTLRQNDNEGSVCLILPWSRSDTLRMAFCEVTYAQQGKEAWQWESGATVVSLFLGRGLGAQRPTLGGLEEGHKARDTGAGRPCVHSTRLPESSCNVDIFQTLVVSK
jgi:hypothetical protein